MKLPDTGNHQGLEGDAHFINGYSETTPYPMRVYDMEVTDVDKINDFLGTKRVGYLGLVDNHGTYIIPLNFTYYKEIFTVLIKAAKLMHEKMI